jgi:uncharacterized protein
MTDTDLAIAAEPLALQPVEPGYRTVLRLQWAVTMIPLIIGAVVLDHFIIRDSAGPYGLLSGLMLLFAVSAITLTAARQYARWGYAMGPETLRVARGYMFHTDTVVPFVRVQHIDVGQGPFERMCGVSHLVVHTAGTHNSIVTLPGLAPDDAAEMRDTIRRHIQTDFA